MSCFGVGLSYVDEKLRIKVLDRKVDHYAKLLAGKEDEWSHEYMQKLIWKGRKKNEK